MCRTIRSHKGLWEVRCNLSSGRIARILFCLSGGRIGRPAAGSSLADRGAICPWIKARISAERPLSSSAKARVLPCRVSLASRARSAAASRNSHKHSRPPGGAAGRSRERG